MMMIMEVVDPVIEPGPFELYKADSGALWFKVRFITGSGFANFALTAKNRPHKDLYQILLGPSCRFVDTTKLNDEMRIFSLPEPIRADYKEFWVTWYNGAICLGIGGQSDPFFTYSDEKITTNNIGFIKFHTMSSRRPVDWLFETSPVNLKPILPKIFEDGQLNWQQMVDGHLPPDALIGGFEDETLYIARAFHNNSLCPGKYVPSKGVAFVAWGGAEHLKDDFEILCGYNARWVKTKDNNIPQNAFVAGYSEVRREPLYIGRAMLDNNLINGKVHVLYKTCYLPYKDKEVEVQKYEILVSDIAIPRGIEYVPEENLNLNRNNIIF